MAKTVRLSSKHQIAIPKALRQKLSLQAGEELLIDAEKGSLVLWPRPKSYTSALRGLGKKVWKSIDPLIYIRQERDAWDKRPSRPL